MAGKTGRNEIEKLGDEELIIELRAQRLSYRDIAKKLKLSHETVRRQVKSIEAKWQRQNSVKHNAEIRKDLVTIDLLIKKAFVAYEKSTTKQLTTSNSEEHGSNDNGPYSVTRDGNQVRKLIGDPRFIQVIKDLIIERHRLMGTYDFIVKQMEEAGQNKGVEQIQHQQTVYIPGLDLTLTPELLQQHPQLWEILHSILANQDPHSWSAADGPGA